MKMVAPPTPIKRGLSAQLGCKPMVTRVVAAQVISGQQPRSITNY